MAETKAILAWLDWFFSAYGSYAQSEKGKNEWIETDIRDWVKGWREYEQDSQRLAIALLKGLATVKFHTPVTVPRSLFKENDSIRWSLIVEEILLRFQLIPY